jgi:hypothetical protein
MLNQNSNISEDIQMKQNEIDGIKRRSYTPPNLGMPDLRKIVAAAGPGSPNDGGSPPNRHSP